MPTNHEIFVAAMEDLLEHRPTRIKRLAARINELENSTVQSPYYAGLVRDALARCRAELAQLQADPGEGGAA